MNRPYFTLMVVGNTPRYNRIIQENVQKAHPRWRPTRCPSSQRGLPPPGLLAACLRRRGRRDRGLLVLPVPYVPLRRIRLRQVCCVVGCLSVCFLYFNADSKGNKEKFCKTILSLSVLSHLDHIRYRISCAGFHKIVVRDDVFSPAGVRNFGTMWCSSMYMV